MVSNFDFLKKDFPVLSNFGKMAEKYCYLYDDGGRTA